MSLIVEDGTSLDNAESYISVSDADVYHSTRGITIWDNATPTEKEQALRRATDYMVGEYRILWSGKRATITQALDWPRCGVKMDDFDGNCRLYPNNVVPFEVRKACAELALRATMGELLEDTEQILIEDTIGPITKKYDPKSSQNKKYPQIVNYLKAYFFNGGSPMMAKLVRV